MQGNSFSLGSRHAARLGMLWWLVGISLEANAAGWPVLPDADGTAMIPAQEWSVTPGPREVKVYVYYSGGAQKNVGPDTGLMLSLHNWGGTHWTGTADPKWLAEHYNVAAICVDYLHSGPTESRGPGPYDFGYLQALDALRALYFVFDGLDKAGKPFARGRIYATGGSGGGNVTLMANKLAPRTFACIIDKCGMARLTDDIAFNLPGGSRLDAGYRQDPADRDYLSADAQALRFVGHPDHLAKMKALGNTCTIVVVHGATDDVCPVADAREMVGNMRSTGLHVEPHFIEKADLDGKILTSTGHPLGDRTLIVDRFAGRYLTPASPDLCVRKGKCDFELRDEEVRYETPNGRYVISYRSGYTVGRFESRASSPPG
jgi:predicted esterase